MADNKKYIKRSESEETLRGFNLNTDNATVYPDFSFDAVMSMVDNDPVARGAVNHFVDKCMEGDMNIVKRDDNSYDPKEELLLGQQYKFRTDIIRKTFLMGKLFNNVFIENVKTSDNKTKALNVLDSTNIEPITKPNGDPIKYKSKRENPKTGRYPEWDTEKITWIKFGDRTQGYAPVDMKALWENLLAKEYVTRYVSWLWKTGQYRLMFHFDTASKDDVESWMSFYRQSSTNFRKPSISKGGNVDAKVLRDMKEIESIERLLKYYDGQTLILLRVPPIDAGIPEASGRSNADAQSNSLATTITSMKKVIEDLISFDLFPKINKGNSLLRFAPNDRFSEEMVFKNLQIMDAVGFTRDAMKEYLSDRGMYFKGKTFDPREDLSKTDNPRALDTMPSRTGKATGTADKKVGTGEQSSTRSDQL